MSEALVSVIVPSFNHASYLRECVDSVLSQDHAAKELIVVDDGSTDGSLDLLRGYGSRIRLLQHSGGRQARARNAGLAAAQGALIAFLDSDDRYRPGRLSAAVQAFDAHPDATLVWSDHCTIDADGAVTATRRWQGGAQPFVRELIAGNPICNATVTVRRDALQSLGGFDEALPRACDGKAWYLLAAHGHRFVHLPRVLVDYRLHAGNDSRQFVAMTRERDLALQAAAKACDQQGLFRSQADLRWLRQVLVRQLAFGAAAQVEHRLQHGRSWRAAVYEGLAGDRGLQWLAGLKRAKDRLLRRP